MATWWHFATLMFIGWCRYVAVVYIGGEVVRTILLPTFNFRTHCGCRKGDAVCFVRVLQCKCFGSKSDVKTPSGVGVHTL